MIKPPPIPDSMPSREDFSAVVRKANNGDQEALAEMRELLDDSPVIWRHMGDLSRCAQESILLKIAGKDELLKESVRRTAKELLGELTTASSSPIERLAAERVVSCWLECHYVNMLHPLPQGATVKQQKYHLSLKDSAQKRYDLAMKSLATLQKMLPSSNAKKKPTNKLAIKMPGLTPEKKSEGPTIRQYDPHNRLKVRFEEMETSDA